MKKSLIFSILLAGLLSSCSNTDDVAPVPVHEEQSSETIAIRSISDAVNITNQLLANLPSDSRSQLTVKADDVKVIRSIRGRSAGLDTLIYAVNFENEQGFTLIAAPQGVTPVLAIIEDGEFGSAETEANEMYQLTIKQIEDYVSSVAPTSTPVIPSFPPITPEPIVPQFKHDTIWYNQKRGPRVDVKWGQGWPLNMYCPNGKAGCAAVTIAQIASYFESPTSIDLAYSNRDQNTQTLNWVNIKKHYGRLSPIDSDILDIHLNLCEASLEDHEALGRFVRQVGHMGSATYNSTPSTSMNTDSAFNVLRNLYPNKTITEGDNIYSVYNLLYNDGVMYIRGTDYSIYAGHGWVADGTLRVKYKATTQTLVQTNPPIYEITDVVNFDERYIHFNWGWEGNFNGFFLEGVFDYEQKDYSDDYWEVTPQSRYSFDEDVRFLHLK